MNGTLLFPTAIGDAGIAWTARGLRAVQLPEATREATEARLRKKLGDDGESQKKAPRWAKELAKDLAAHVRGDTKDFRGVTLDDAHLPPFERKIYEALRDVPAGTTASYGDLAERAGSPGAARAVGQAMGKNPWPIVVPCHRVLGSGTSFGGFSAFGGAATKVRLLAYEGHPIDPIAWLKKHDKELGKLVTRVGPFPGDARGLTPTEARSTFEVLAKSIVYQQLNGRAAQTIWSRVQVVGGAKRFSPSVVMATKDEALRGAGLSQNKLRALRDLAERTERGEIPTLDALGALDDETIIDTLTQVRGVGPWTVQMLLIFRLGRPDVLPLADYGVQQGFQRAFGLARLPTPLEMAERAEVWRPYRSIASWYLWRAAEMPEQLSLPGAQTKKTPAKQSPTKKNEKKTR